MKKQCRLSFDRISELPSSISQSILMCLPLRDMARTSALSKHWRYQWTNVPRLVFEDDPNFADSQQERYRYNAMKVFEILLLHHGPLLKFSLDMTAWLNCSVIDRIIPFLSRNKIKELTLLMPNEGEHYKLPSSILFCVELRHLSLSSCVFQPFTCVGFSKLVSLELLNVTLDFDVSISSCPLLESLTLHCFSCCFSVDAPNMKFLFLEGDLSLICYINTPLLEVLLLANVDFGDRPNKKMHLVKVLQSLPLLQKLNLQFILSECLDIGDSSYGSAALLNNLRTLELGDNMFSGDDLPTFLWLLQNSPYIEKLKITLFSSWEQLSIEWKFYLKLQEHLNYPLLKLHEVEIVIHFDWSDLSVFLEFFMFLLDISPELKTLYIGPLSITPIDAIGYKTLLELACYPRASPKAKIVYVGL